jgi:hypothetical protein
VRGAYKAAVVAAVLVAGGATFGALSGSSGSSPVTIDTGGGQPAVAPGTPGESQPRTLPPVGNAPQDPGGGGGGSENLAQVGPPGRLAAVGSVPTGGSEEGPRVFYLSGVSLLDINRGAVGSGQVTFPATGGIGCNSSPEARGRWTAVPLRRPVTLYGASTARIRVQVSGSVTLYVAAVDLLPNGGCADVTVGSAPAHTGTVTVHAPAVTYQYGLEHTAAIVITASGAGSVTVLTDGANPSTVTVPRVTGL